MFALTVLRSRGGVARNNAGGLRSISGGLGSDAGRLKNNGSGFRSDASGLKNGACGGVAGNVNVWLADVGIVVLSGVLGEVAETQSLLVGPLASERSRGLDLPVPELRNQSALDSVRYAEGYIPAILAICRR